jgi:hypothetical protein
MPRSLAVCAVIFVGGCFFQADYGSGTIACTDGRCPSGLTCSAEVCVEPTVIDAPVDTIDARIPAFTCADPGILASTGGGDTGDTTGKPFVVSSMCGGFVMNGHEAVYKIELTAGKQLLVSLASSARKAYVIASCTPPAPACLGNMFATAGNPINVSPAAGASFVIVDDENPSNSGAYTLGVTVQ